MDRGNPLMQQPSRVRKFVMFGPESTGKSTLCRDLAAYYGTECNPEFMRTYLQEKWDRYRETCTPDDILPIARGQIQNENRLTARARNGMFFTDTDLLELVVYSEAYYGRADEELRRAAEQNRYDLYFLTFIDVPWEPDDLRDKPNEREEMFARFEQALQKLNRPYVILKGNRQERLRKAVQYIETMKKSDVQFTENDIRLLREKGLTVEDVLEQLHRLQQGRLYQKIVRPATVGDGIRRLSPEELVEYENISAEIPEAVRFVPASGAATRMFKDLILMQKARSEGITDWQEAVEKHGLDRLKDFPALLRRIAFYEPLMEAVRQDYPDFDTLDPNEKNWIWLEYILGPSGLHYADTPKALVLFHRYADDIRTAFAEHLHEALATESIPQKLHFTVNPLKEKDFVAEKNRRPEAARLEVEFSYQNPATDTVMLDEQGRLMRDEQGRILFRPGGHGSLLENLQRAGEFVFVKNIDNVQKEEYRDDTLRYFRVLLGLLKKLKDERDKWLRFLEEEKPGKEALRPVEKFLEENFGIRLIEGYEGLPASHRREYLAFKLNRPLRVAGMVKNTGQPGGGPFWVEDENGRISLQIVEKSEINLDDPQQRQLFEQSTHFNPVFMALALTDHQGKPYDLFEFRKENTGFVSEKIQYGRKVRIYEHPGLWNGSMYDWLTVFVEVPLSVFSPVKEFYDLSRPPHTDEGESVSG